MRIYAVGDIHGRADLVEQLQHHIEQDAGEHAGKELHLVYLGDYVDRGPNSREVLEHLSTKSPPGFVTHYLMGNHEQAMLNFLADPDGAAQWLEYGGLATVESYTSDGWEIDPGDVTDMAMALRDAIPDHQLAFLKELGLYQRLGDYLFVHAGIRPGIPLNAQRADDLLWIRGEFLSSTKAYPFVVVHGHHVGEAVEVHPNRICVDTGAYATGSLSCLILDGADRLRMDTREGGPFPLEGEAYAHG